jgi:hypothetical protein
MMKLRQTHNDETKANIIMKLRQTHNDETKANT